MHPARAELARAQRVIVKIGSKALAGENDLVAGLAPQIRSLMKGRRSFVIVTSGAIALGWPRLGYRRRPKEMPGLQAAAAAGQSILMQRYSEAFGAEGLVTAQVLLTHADLADRVRVNNARQALAALLEAGAIPIINENDTVSTEEIRFGDNDQLASLVVPLTSADALLLLTDVEGVLDESGERIAVMHDQAKIGTLRREGPGTGGIASKIDAAMKASRAGATVVVAPASRAGVVMDVLAGRDVGTLFPRHDVALRARHHWIMYTLRPQGEVLLDEGAARAVGTGRTSLLPVGVLGVRGHFRPGDAIRLVTPDGKEVGRGLARLGSADVALAAGKKGEALAALLGEAAAGAVVVHRDDLVVLR